MADETEEYKDAVWDYMLEHSDMTPNGVLFVKFHTDSRKSFEKHIRARIVGYHRINPRIREEDMKGKREAFEKEKTAKKMLWRAGKEERKRINEINVMPAWKRTIAHRVYKIKKWYNDYTRETKDRRASLRCAHCGR